MINEKQILVSIIVPVYNAEEYLNNILLQSIFFKLNWKREYKKEVNGKNTFYGHFLEKQCYL